VTIQSETYCARHPNVETGLRCGRCDTPICPKCMVMTDVGARCPECAPRRKLPQFELSPLMVLRGLGAGVGAGAALGAVWGLTVPFFFGFFSIFIGIGLGYAVAESISLATNRKSGPVLQAFGAIGVTLAWVARNLIASGEFFIFDDLGGLIALGVGIISAVNRLRM
jgi:hypothetical protein